MGENISLTNKKEKKLSCTIKKKNKNRTWDLIGYRVSIETIRLRHRWKSFDIWYSMHVLCIFDRQIIVLVWSRWSINFYLEKLSTLICAFDIWCSVHVPCIFDWQIIVLVWGQWSINFFSTEIIYLNLWN